MFEEKSSGIAKTISRFTFGLVFIILFVFSSSASLFYYTNELQETKDNLDAIRSLSLASIEEALWTFDNKSLDKLVKSIIRTHQSNTKARLKIVVFDEKDNLLHESEAITASPTFEWRIENNIDITRDGKKIGTMLIIYTTMHPVFFSTIILIISFALSALATWVTSRYLSQVLNRYLFKPLNQIVSASKAISSGDVNTLIPVFPNTELHDLSLHLSSMVETIKSQNDDLFYYNSKLEQEVKERTEELESQRAKSFENSRLASLGQMSSNIAHEINNPLAIIVGKAHLIEKLSRAQPIDTSKIQLFSNEVIKTAHRISKTIAGMRALARDGSKDKLSLTSLHSIMLPVLETCSHRYKTLGITINAKIEENIQFECREVQMIQVLVNLLNNSIDSIERLNEKWINIEAKTCSGYVEIAVTDSGNHIPQDVQKKMMEPFFTTKAPNKGTGLGLSISKQIVNDHGGELQYDANSVHTRFIVLIPIRAACLAS